MTSVPEPALRLERVSKVYRGRGEDVCALQDVDLDVASGEFVCLVGQSGCGKSTLLEIVAGQELWLALALFWRCVVTASWAKASCRTYPGLASGVINMDLRRRRLALGWG